MQSNTSNGGELANVTKALVLLSGGPDSATLIGHAQKKYASSGASLTSLYLRTGHGKDDRELEAASAVSSSVGARLDVVDLAPVVKALGGKLPTIHSEASIMRFGNALVLSVAVAYAFEAGHEVVMIGLHKDDAAESKEYTREYIDRVQALAAFAYPKIAPAIETPFLEMNKVEVFRLGKTIGVDYSLTWSCIRGEELHCGVCGACRARRRAFNLNGMNDPTRYEVEPAGLGSVG